MLILNSYKKVHNKFFNKLFSFYKKFIKNINKKSLKTIINISKI